MDESVSNFSFDKILKINLDIECDKHERLNLSENSYKGNQLEIKGFGYLDDILFSEDLIKIKKLILKDLKTDNNFSFLFQLVNLNELCIYNIHISHFYYLLSLVNLKKLTLNSCNITTLIDLDFLSNRLEYLDLSNNKNLINITDLGKLINLTYLNISGCEQISDLSCLYRLKNLNELYINGCKNIVNIYWLYKLPIKIINFNFCQNIPQFQTKKLIAVIIKNIAKSFIFEETKIALIYFNFLPIEVKNEIYKIFYEIKKDKPDKTELEYGQNCFLSINGRNSTIEEKNNALTTYINKFKVNFLINNPCVICFDKEINIIIIPCCHACLCKNCSYKIFNCPICRVSVKNFMKFYLS
ncbi:RING finger type zinc finger protein [uncultured virus]|nr:RING finger type zinc finger protein [uncultured virus]